MTRPAWPVAQAPGRLAFMSQKAAPSMPTAMANSSVRYRPMRLIALMLSASLLTTASIAAPGDAPAARSATGAAAATAIDRSPWLYEGSDIPRDEGWQFGTLSNGLRYAVRRTGVPPGQVAIRLRVDVGSLMEEPQEAGWAHLIEHLVFRESRYLRSGEARREWQRLGVSFGSDTNASTTPTATSFQLDIPAATPEGVAQSMRYLSGMIRDPVLNAATVDAERPIVQAERRERDGVQFRIENATRQLLFAGQRLADHSPIGTEASLNGANAAGVAAFHRRWYRPDRVVIAIAGDLDPALLERTIIDNFADWRATGPAPSEPDFGRPTADAPNVRQVVEANQPLVVNYAVIRPWQRVTDSIAYTQQLMLNTLASMVINRRLEERARSGGQFLAAQVDMDKPSRSADITTVSVIPLEGNWQGAMRDVRAIVEAARQTAPTVQEIQREHANIQAFLAREAANAQNEPATKQAEDLLNAVDIGETTTSPQHALGLWQSILPLATPERILETTRTILSGTATRAMITTPQPIAEAETQLAQIITASPAALAANDNGAGRRISFADLPRLGRPGRVISRTPIERLDMERWELSNGVTAIVRQTPIEPGKIRIRVRFGGGRQSVAPTDANLLWAGEGAMVESGIGRFDQSAIERLINGRQIGMAFDVDDDAFEFDAETRPEDLRDQLRLLATKFAAPGWQAQPVVRARAGRLLSYDMMQATPMAVIDNQLQGILYSADRRWVPPTRAEIEALTPQAFRAFWEPRLASGPIELLVFGDTSSVNLAQMLAETFGALPPRRPLAVPPAANDVRPVTPPAAPLRLTHRGEAAQAAAVLAYPTGGGIADQRTARQLDVMAAIFNDRLFERLRDQSGASYSQAVMSNWSNSFRQGGYIFVGGLVRPQDTELMFRLSREIATDLANNPVSNDELQRARGPLVEQVLRAASGNVFWMHFLEGASRDPQIIQQLLRYVPDLAQTTPADVQRLARQYLAPGRAVPVLVLPDAAVAGAAAPTAAAAAATR